MVRKLMLNVSRRHVLAHLCTITYDHSSSPLFEHKAYLASSCELIGELEIHSVSEYLPARNLLGAGETKELLATGVGSSEPVPLILKVCCEGCSGCEDETSIVWLTWCRGWALGPGDRCTQSRVSKPLWFTLPRSALFALLICCCSFL